MKNKTVIRKANVNGQFTTVHNSILRDKRLSPNGFRLLVNILSDSDENFKLSPTVYCNRLDITKSTFFKAISNLEECGYIKREESKLDKSKNHYTVSEYGNLTPNQNEVTKNNSISTNKQEVVESQSTLPEGMTQEFYDYMLTLVNLMDYKEFERLLINEWLGDLGISTKAELEKKVKAYLVGVYSEYLGFAMNPDKHPKALEEYKKWLKKEIFTNHNLSINARSKWSYLSLIKHKKPHKTDFETEMGDYYENPKD
ncbi:MarR family transcriptional regulator [Flavobacterium sp. N1994]|uniref:MarR family transcriptional regulator n=1 Tax=Flavobacterium sp. N1994 TaxID=2986827 RepID=UPI002222D7DF|nr:helix-turn-helix domain-containing protein [Flavobacterium sp. N1994]